MHKSGYNSERPASATDLRDTKGTMAAGIWCFLGLSNGPGAVLGADLFTHTDSLNVHNKQ
jgi:hypothetical protein